MNIFAFGARVELDGILGADLKERAQNLLSPWSQSTKGFEDKRLKVGVVLPAAVIVFLPLGAFSNARSIQVLLGSNLEVSVGGGVEA